MSAPKTPPPRQRKAYKPTMRDNMAILSVAHRMVHGWAEHFECDPAFFDTLKALQLQADRMERALGKTGVEIHKDIKAGFDKDLPLVEKGEKLNLNTPSSIWDSVAKPPAKITNSTG